MTETTALAEFNKQIDDIEIKIVVQAARMRIAFSEFKDQEAALDKLTVEKRRIMGEWNGKLKK